MTESKRTVIAPGWALALGSAFALGGCAPEPAADSGETGAESAVTGIRYLAGGEESDGFARATTPRPFEFPADHDAHPGYRTEWWYFTGNVFDAGSNHYGFELTIFRIALAPERAARESALAAHEIWMAHLAVTDTARELFQTAERLSRGAAGLAGIEGTGDGEPLVVAVEDFSIAFEGDRVRLAAADAGFGIDLELAGLDRIVAQGDDGVDPKGPEPGNASYYFSAPRLTVEGQLRSGSAAPVAVEGSAWMDREWSTSALSPDIEGWDWFALQLDDGRDLMFYRLRGRDGSTSPFSGGTVADAGGEVARLGAEDVELRVLREWTSPATRVSYPVAWELAIPGQDLELEIRPRLDAQELDLTVRYWEGAVRVSGTAGGSLEGVGYLELAGY